MRRTGWLLRRLEAPPLTLTRRFSCEGGCARCARRAPAPTVPGCPPPVSLGLLVLVRLAQGARRRCQQVKKARSDHHPPSRPRDDHTEQTLALARPAVP